MIWLDEDAGWNGLEGEQGCTTDWTGESLHLYIYLLYCTWMGLRWQIAGQ